jgi:hypothetical protein
MIGLMQPADSTTQNPRGAAELRLDVSPVRLTPADRQPVEALLEALSADVAPLADMNVGQAEPATIYRPE